jgi:hypothetical protein
VTHNLDVNVVRVKKPILILDSKYKEFEDTPEISHVAQRTLYSNSTGVKNCCCLIYAGKPKVETRSYFLHQGIKFTSFLLIYKFSIYINLKLNVIILIQ